MTGGTHVPSFVRRYHAYLAIIVVVALVVLLPGRDDHRSGVTTAGDAAAVSAGGASAGGGTSPLDGGAPTALDASGGSAGASGSAVGADASSTAASAAAAPGEYPGIGTPEALANPKCDRATKKVRFPSQYSPPCVRPWPAGADNGGATAQGVSADKIKIVVYTKTPQPPSKLSPQRQEELIKQAINLRVGTYETWGRKFDIVIFRPSGDDEVAQRADAIQIATSIKPFVATDMTDFTAVHRVWAQEMAARGVVVWTPGITYAEATQRPGYRWGYGPDDRLHSQLTGEYVAKRLYGRPAKSAGDPVMKTQTRKFGVIYDEKWDLRSFQAALQKYQPGATVADAIAFNPEDPVTSLQEKARVQIARLKDKGVNNVIAVSGILPTLFLTQAATSANYFPEWTVTGWAQQDNAVTGKLYDPQQWRNASGFGGLPPLMSNTQDNESVYQYKWVYGQTLSTDDAGFFVQMVVFAWQFSTAVHLAGPHLTVETHRNALFSMPPSGGRWCGCVQSLEVSYGRHLTLYGGDKYFVSGDVVEKWWDPSTIGDDEVGLKAPGVWQAVNGGKRYLPGDFPGGDAPMFDKGSSVHGFDGYDSLPPADKYPRYPK